MIWWASWLVACGPEPPAEVTAPVQCDPVAPIAASPLRRLTRSEVAHAVADVFGVEGIEPLLGADERVGPFAANSVTPVSRLTVEQYLETAEHVAASADLQSLNPCNLLVEAGRDCATQFVAEFGPRVYRRPLTEEQQASLLAIYDAFAEDGHLAALRVVMQAMLQSPWFLYHHELAAPAEAGELAALDGWSLASRLSFFLWKTTPDDGLLNVAASGGLDSVEGLRETTLRMLADPRAAQGIGQMHLEWLGVDRLPDIAKDPQRFPDYTAQQQQEMMQEVAAFADQVIRHGDGELATLLTQPHGFAGEPARTGLLGLAGVLATHAHYQRSSLTLRGKLVREELLCQPLPDPPPDVDISLPEIAPGATTREAVAAHLTTPQCAGCHALVDPLGFAFESYDAVGAFRTLDNGATIDTTGELTAADVEGPFDGPAELAEQLAMSQDVQWCVTRQWFRYALGRPDQPEDACSLEQAWLAMHQPHNLRELIVAIVESDAFRFRRAP